MKKFLFTIVKFLFVAALFAYLRPLYLMINEKYQKEVASDEVYVAIDKSKQKTKYKKVVIGDSVAANLFNPSKEYKEVNSLASCIGTEPFGQYLLLKNYIEAGNQIETAFWIYRPFSFGSNISNRLSYNYFLKPFYRTEYKDDYTDLIHHQVKQFPFYFLCQEPSILTSDWTPNFKPKTDAKSFTFLSPVAVDAIKSMQKLAEEHDFDLVILPAPLIEQKQAEVLAMNQQEIEENNLSDVFHNYFNNIIYLDSTHFFADRVHLLEPQPLTEKYLTELMN